MGRWNQPRYNPVDCAYRLPTGWITASSVKGDLMWQSITANWKTTLAGILTFLTSVPAFVTAIEAWGRHQPVDWRSVLVSVAITAAGAGLLVAKDSTTHSTLEEVRTSTIKEEIATAKAENPPPKP